jgi:hypothetical protein
MLFLYSCSSVPVSEQESETSPTVQSDVSEEKTPVWVTVVEDEYFVSQETIKYEDGFVDGYRLYEYDEDGKILSKSQIGSDESVISEEIFSYNSDGLLMQSDYISSGKLVSYSEFTYDENKRVIEEAYFNPKGELLSVSSYEYDDKGRRTKWVSGDSGGIPMMYTQYEYKNNKLVQMNYYMPAGDLEGYTQLEYEGDKLVLEATYSPTSKLEKKTEYVFQEDRLDHALYYMGKTLIRTVKYSYDQTGNVIEETTMNRHGDIIDIIEKEYVVFAVEKTVLQ